MWLLSYYHNTVQLNIMWSNRTPIRVELILCVSTVPHWPTRTFLQIMKRPCMAQCHEICLFLEHRVTFAMICVAMIYVLLCCNHKILISYLLWKGHGEMKISPISTERKDAHISNSPRWERTLIHVCGANITARGSGVLKLFKVFQLYTCLKCTQSTPTMDIYFPSVHLFAQYFLGINRG